MADITSAHLAELRAVAEAATPGPWVFDPPGMWGDGDDIPQSAVRQIDSGSITWDDHGGEVFKPEDAAHVATFDPPTVLALIAALEGLSTTNENLAAYARKAEAALEAKTAEVAEMSKENDDLADEIMKLRRAVHIAERERAIKKFS